MIESLTFFIAKKQRFPTELKQIIFLNYIIKFYLKNKPGPSYFNLQISSEFIFEFRH